ncbi:EAL domain-containing protein [Vibrio sp. JC009]|uniref:putative bifunctional diguanylate cyclase/phosphodiesterase n=1 Tax=Vibrio sp. JC009 TaxID=2912314 RepID=UPI0023AFE592|nr:GGDEF domain-containing phosphodiesterase [Vibrio sp. JC009]WED22618.1 EAL domain-containing protein [Vibrio sp. JC009]
MNKSNFKPKLIDIVRGNLNLVATLQPTFIRNCKVTDMALDEKYLLFFSIVDQSANSVAIFDDKKRIVYVNKKFERMSGYTCDELLGKHADFLRSAKTAKEVYQDIYRTIEAKQQWKGEVVNIHRDGHEYIVENIISPITNTRDEIVCVLAEKKDITAQKSAESVVQKLTYFDCLTGVPNRAYFLQEVKGLTCLPQVKENHFAVLFIDLNRFKDLNDTYGHLVGDRALNEIAKRLEARMPSGSFVARVGGDEFVAVHKNATNMSTSLLANLIEDSFKSPVIVEGQEHFLDASIGSATWPTDGLCITQILARADLAMYNGKVACRSYTPYTEAIGLSFTREYELARKLDIAVKEGQFSLVYQPKVDLITGHTTGMEALLRWNDLELGPISPAEFIPIAEKYKKMIPIGRWVIREVCRQLNLWKSSQTCLSGRIAINISAQQVESPRFFEDIKSELYEHDIDPSMIELEVTESLLIKDPERALSLFQKLKTAGFSISIDDFGTGYSSLSYLRQLEADILKIDKSFIDKINSSPHDRTIVKSIIDLSHNLDMLVIAEGVESEEQLNLLFSLGCDMAQGYLFCKPLPAREVYPFLSRYRQEQSTSSAQLQPANCIKMLE